jgi:hypothetical protein
MRRRSVLLAVAICLLSPGVYAQSSAPSPESFRLEWIRRPGWMRPGVDGYLYNDSRWRVTNVRVRAQVVDGAGSVLRETVVSVFGNAVPGARTFFVLPPLKEAESYALKVVSFDLISQEAPPAQQQGP